jgi:cytosine/uracil/thiamine/allantoin permease
MIGQVVALPTTMTVFAAMGVLITSATVIIYGKAIWDPVQLCRTSRRRWWWPSPCSRRWWPPWR